MPDSNVEMSSVPIDPPDPRPEDWDYVVHSLIGGLDYAGVVRWLSLWPDLDTAVREARKHRGGMVAT